MLHINGGKNHVREYEHDFNAQEICKTLVTFHTKSTKAKLNATEILSCTTSDKRCVWRGSLESFIINCQDQMCLHEPLVKTDRHLPDDLNKILLENAVESNSKLRTIKD